MIDIPEMLARLEQPDYIGENRCLPCTAINVAIAVALAVAVGIAVAVPAGALALAVSLGLVRYRGYLIPGTPTLTRRYLPERVLATFGKGSSNGPTIETVSTEALTDILTATEVATERDGALRPTASVRERWDERLSSDGGVEPGTAAVESMFDADEVERLDDTAFVLDGRKRVRWASTATLAADIAAAPTLRSRLEGWGALEVDERRDLLRGLRLLRERCPACGGPLVTNAERLEHCCRRPRVGIRSVCADCDRPLVDLVVAESAAGPWLELAGVALADDSTPEP